MWAIFATFCFESETADSIIVSENDKSLPKFHCDRIYNFADDSQAVNCQQ